MSREHLFCLENLVLLCRASLKRFDSCRHPAPRRTTTEYKMNMPRILTTALLSLVGLLDIASARGAATPIMPPGQQNIPVATPTCAACAGSTEAPPSTPINLTQAVAGCSNIRLAGTNYTCNDVLGDICKPSILIDARGTTEDPNTVLSRSEELVVFHNKILPGWH